jgi:hypothetical protein
MVCALLFAVALVVSYRFDERRGLRVAEGAA